MYHLYEGCIRFKLRCLRACSARAQSDLTSRVGGMSPVVKQMMSNTVVAMLDVCCMASQFKSSLATVAGSVALFTHCKAVQLWAMTNFYHPKLKTQARSMCGPNELLVSVHSTNNVNEKVYISLWYWPPANSAALDDFYSIFFKFGYQCFFVLYSWEILILTFVITTIHFLASYLVFFTKIGTYVGRTSA